MLVPYTWPSVSCRCGKGENKELMIFGFHIWGSMWTRKPSVSFSPSSVLRRMWRTNKHFNAHSLLGWWSPINICCNMSLGVWPPCNYYGSIAPTEIAQLSVKFGGLRSPLESFHKKGGLRVRWSRASFMLQPMAEVFGEQQNRVRYGFADASSSAEIGKCQQLRKYELHRQGALLLLCTEIM